LIPDWIRGRRDQLNDEPDICLRKAGFHPWHPEPDWEGIVYYLRFKDPRARPHRPESP
jgi:hypothetical protein